MLSWYLKPKVPSLTKALLFLMRPLYLGFGFGGNGNPYAANYP
jgi:hypothetical protein